MIKSIRWIWVSIALCMLGANAGSAELPAGAVEVPAFTLPPSSLLDPSTYDHVKRYIDNNKAGWAKAESCGNLLTVPPSEAPAVRQCQAESFYKGSYYKALRDRFPVKLTTQQIAGVTTEIFEPQDGVSPANARRVLINLHGGAFIGGSRTVSHMESIPIAAVGKIKVISVDYRQAPEYTFPAASDDVVAVYRELLTAYSPRNIGIYGCSAGGLLTAQVVTRLQKEKLPPPAAVGMFCEGGAYWTEGDIGRFAIALEGAASKIETSKENPYLKNVDPSEPLAFPVRSTEALAKFPPSLLIASTRDLALSSVAHTHSLLVQQGVEADLHVWEGLGHAFFMDPELPQSRDLYAVVVKFFDKNLGRGPKIPATVTADPKVEDALAAEVEAFVAADRASPPKPGQVLFVGSSTFRMWTALPKDMMPIAAVNRGFGGSQIEYVNRWFDQLITPHKPRAIVFYAGENDIAAGKSVDRVVADFNAFMQKKTAALGQTPVYFVSLKPSQLRIEQFVLQTQVNESIRALAEQRKDLHFISVVPAMLQDGKPRQLFLDDGLHMNAEGYALWTRIIKAALKP